MGFWALPPAGREEGFAELRASAPVPWHRQPESKLLPESEGTGGYWAVVRYEDVREISRDPERFCSGEGVMFEDIPAELLEASQSFLAMDDPRHATLRKLVAEGFKPRAVKADRGRHPRRRAHDRGRARATSSRATSSRRSRSGCR